MDPFRFDQKFARYMARVDTQAIQRGTDLYEAGQARVSRADAETIEGSVTDGKAGVFRVILKTNDEGGFSGTCSCDTFFNCRHSYALARAARDQILGKPQNLPTRSKPDSSNPEMQALKERAGGTLDAEQTRFFENMRRLFNVSKGADGLLYPKDLHAFAAHRRHIGQSPAEPLRDLKRWLKSADPKDPIEMADLLKGYFEYKGYAAEPVFAEFARARRFDREATTGERGKSAASWDRSPLRLSYTFKLEPTADRDWFQISADAGVVGEDLTKEQIRRLIEAKGELVQIEGKGWLRIDPTTDSEQARLLQSFGLDERRGNRQRIHVTQIEELLPGSIVDSEHFESAVQRARALQAVVLPEPPSSLRDVLRPYQREGFQFLCRLTQFGFGGILADDMGLGKTLQTLCWLVWLAEEEGKHGGFKVLVVCPKSVTDNWIQEPRKFETGLTAAAFRPNLVEDSAVGDANIVVANYAQLRLNAGYFLGREWDVSILDEGQYIKSPDAQTTKIAYQLNAKQRLILTGTPIENSLMDLWSLMRFAMPRLLGPQATFRVNYSGDGPEVLDGLKKRIRPFMLRRLKGEVARELPARIEEEIHCELEGAQQALYEEEVSVARAALRAIKSAGAFNKERFNVLQALLRIRQICCDPRLLDTEWPQDEPSAKVQALLDIALPLIAEGHKVLVFSQFVKMLEIIERTLLQRGVKSLSLTGKTQNRKELIDRFHQEGSEQVFLLSLKAAGSGLNLTAASYVILFDPWWNPAVEAQAIDRTHRIGQTNQVIAYRILAKGTVEEKIRLIQSEKADLARSVVGEESLHSALGLEDLRRLFD